MLYPPNSSRGGLARGLWLWRLFTRTPTPPLCTTAPPSPTRVTLVPINALINLDFKLLFLFTEAKKCLVWSYPSDFTVIYRWHTGLAPDDKKKKKKMIDLLLTWLFLNLIPQWVNQWVLLWSHTQVINNKSINVKLKSNLVVFFQLGPCFPMHLLND